MFDVKKILKQHIVNLAVKGQLCKQDLNDAPASDLLKRIQVEKGSELQSYNTKEVPFELPMSWEWARLGDICHNWGQKTPNKSFTYIDVGSIDNENGLIKENLAVLRPEEAPSRARKIVQLGTIIYSTVRPYLLNVAIIDKLIEPEPIVSTAFAVLHPYDQICQKYLFYYLRSSIFIDYVSSQMVGMAYPAINDEKLKAGLIAIPPITEQRRIVEAIESIFKAIDGNKNDIQINMEYKMLVDSFAKLSQLFMEYDKNNGKALEYVYLIHNRILQDAVQGKLVPQDPNDEPASELLKKIRVEKEKLIQEGKIKWEKSLPEIKEEEIPYELPKGWEWVRLGDICSHISDIDHNMPKSVKDGVKYLSAKDLFDDGTLNFTKDIKYISEEDYERLSRKIRPQKGDIIYSRIGAKLGKARIVEVDEKFLVSYSCCTFRALIININYLNKYLDSGLVLNQALKGTQSIGVPDLGIQRIKEFLVPIPPLNEQKRIFDKVNQLINLCNDLESNIYQSNKDCESLIQSVLQEVF